MIIKAVFAIGATIAGLFLFAASAAFAIFVIIGLILIGLIVFVIVWVRAKVFGKPFGPQMRFSQTFQDLDAQFKTRTSHDPHASKSQSKRYSGRENGPIIDAHRTPEGWSVDQ